MLEGPNKKILEDQRVAFKKGSVDKMFASKVAREEEEEAASAITTMENSEA